MFYPDSGLLAISTETDNEYAVSYTHLADSEQLLQELNLKLYGYEQIYGRLEEEVNPNQRLMGLIKRAYEQTGKKVVVLIDEYDAPLLDVVHERENLDVLRNICLLYTSPVLLLSLMRK